MQISFSYSDGFGREIQKKIQAEPGQSSTAVPIVNPRWVGSGWTIYQQQGQAGPPVRAVLQPLRQKATSSSSACRSESAPSSATTRSNGSSPRIHPNHTYEKVVFDPWRQETWDVNDTVLTTKTRTPTRTWATSSSGLPSADYLPTWYTQRSNGGLGAQEQDAAAKSRQPTPNTSDGRLLRHAGPHLPDHRRQRRRLANTRRASNSTSGQPALGHRCARTAR